MNDAENPIEILQFTNSPVNDEIFQLNLANKLKRGSEGLLTKKESLIASHLISGYTVNEIAKLLCRSRNTIKMHIKNMRKKFKCGTQARLGAILQGFTKNQLERV